MLDADMVFKAIGQAFVADALDGAGEAIALEGGRIKVDGERRTTCAASGPAATASPAART